MFKWPHSRHAKKLALTAFWFSRSTVENVNMEAPVDFSARNYLIRLFSVSNCIWQQCRGVQAPRAQPAVAIAYGGGGSNLFRRYIAAESCLGKRSRGTPHLLKKLSTHDSEK